MNNNLSKTKIKEWIKLIESDKSSIKQFLFNFYQFCDTFDDMTSQEEIVKKYIISLKTKIKIETHQLNLFEH
jgi:hypothetical protein